MTDDVTDHDSTKGPLEQAIDVLVYAPIGLLFSGPSLVPKLVEEGRNQARAGRMFGEFAVKQGRAELKRRLATFEEHAGETIRLFTERGDTASHPGPPGAGTGARNGASGATGATRADAGADRPRGTGPAARPGATGPRSSTLRPSTARPSTARPSTVRPTPGANGSSGVSGPSGTAGASGDGVAATPSPAVDDLAIPDYDSLSASQVVTRLDGLGPDELEAVRAYEAAHRGRKTILNKAAQLQA